VKPVALILALAALASGLATSALAAETRASLPDIEDEVMCVTCGVLLAEEPDAPQANSERVLIRRLIAQGKTKDQIKDTLVAQYGPRVLATPTGHGFDLLAWIVPALAILLAAAGLVVMALRMRRRRTDRKEVPPELDPADSARLDRELSSYDG
jgi:cytochrome c-type biogenesis protein CcmH